MRILCTNDDGVNAEGLAVLERIAARFSDDVWVIAPENEQSGSSRALSLSTPIRVRQLGDKRFAVAGTPTDCVLLGVHDFLADKRPDLVLSGVNRGQNIAEDVTFSGTIAGAMQGMQLGVRAVAFSQTRGLRPEAHGGPFAVAETYGAGVLGKLIEARWPAGVFMSVNFPDGDPDGAMDVEVTTQGLRDQQLLYFDKRTDLRGGAYYLLGFRNIRSTAHEGTDIKAIYEGRISVTPLHIDLTHRPTIHDLKGLLGGAAPKRP